MLNNIEVKLQEKAEEKETAAKKAEEKRNRMKMRKAGRSRKSWFETLGVVILLGCLLNFAAVSAHQTILQQGIAESVLRFHVLANSDSEEDQAVKLEVRDAVLKWISEEMERQESEIAEKLINEDEVKSTDELANDNKVKMKLFLLENMEEIEAVADQVLEKHGMTYRAAAKTEQCYFPDRTYGACTFPAGWYEALRISLGEAEGHNWWCVLYPRLCFSDCLHVVAEEANNQEEAESAAEDITVQEETESAAEDITVQEEMVSVEEEQLRELEEVLTVEEYEYLLNSPGEWKIGWRWKSVFSTK